MNIEGTICRLRALEPDDLDTMYRWENDTNIWRVSGTTAPFSRHSLMRLIDEQRFDIYATRQQRLVIETTDTPQPAMAGTVDLFEFDPQNLRAGVGIMTAPEMRGRGYGADALKALEGYCRETLHLHQLWCEVSADNEASMRLFTAAGYEECSRRRDWILTPEGWRDEILLQKILQPTL